MGAPGGRGASVPRASSCRGWPGKGLHGELELRLGNGGRGGGLGPQVLGGRGRGSARFFIGARLKRASPGRERAGEGAELGEGAASARPAGRRGGERTGPGGVSRVGGAREGGLGEIYGRGGGLAGGATRGRPGGRRQRTDAIVGWEQGGGKVEDEDSGKTVNKEKFRVLFCKLNFSPYL